MVEEVGLELNEDGEDRIGRRPTTILEITERLEHVTTDVARLTERQVTRMW